MQNNEFVKKILPGNYNLTKSMEISKVTYSGTLWYTKKFLVLYNVIFLKGNLETLEYFNEVHELFSNYIESLDQKVQEEAKKFFYNDKQGFYSTEIKSFNEFRDHVNYGTEEERRKSLINAKKYYFVYLMETGGQSKLKKEIKSKLLSENFKFSLSNLKRIIETYNEENHEQYNTNQIINDYNATLRNERQILYYYGYFHSKSTGAQDMEFSSLTPVGELAYLANAKEFQILWEHQKIKMISQPISVTINNLPKMQLNFEDFSINYSPYIDIFKYLNEYDRLPLDNYQYILSRNKENENVFNENLPYLIENIEYIKEKIKSYGRNRDIETEDFRKELKKYLLGITDEFNKDKNTNILGVIKSSNNIEILDKPKFELIYKNYIELENYKREKYKNLFNSVNHELRSYYVSQAEGVPYEKNQSIKTNWNLYNGKIEESILINILFMFITFQLNKVETDINYNEFLDVYKNEYPNITTYFNYNNSELKELFDMRQNKKIIIVRDELVENLTDTDATYIEGSVQDLKQKILDLSNSSNFESILNQNRQRNQSLISAMKKYYVKAFDQEFTEEYKTSIKCESCKEKSFITSNNSPYMEFHHIIPFGGATKGQDHYLNLINLCPTCHTKLHRINEEDKKVLYKEIDENNYLSKTIKDRLLKLKKEKLLKSYQLEFLLSESAITESDYNKIGEYNE